jgi:hypothetical protein
MLAARIFLGASALLWTPYAVQCLLDPGSLAEAAGVAATSATGTAELRAMYGGLQAALGLLALAGALRPAAFARHALVALAVLAGGLGLARLGAALAGDAFSPYTGMALGFELGSLAIASALLSRMPSAAQAAS